MKNSNWKTDARIKPEYILSTEAIVEPDMVGEDWADFELGISRVIRYIFLFTIYSKVTCVYTKSN